MKPLVPLGYHNRDLFPDLFDFAELEEKFNENSESCTCLDCSSTPPSDINQNPKKTRKPKKIAKIPKKSTKISKCEISKKLLKKSDKQIFSSFLDEIENDG